MVLKSDFFKFKDHVPDEERWQRLAEHVSSLPLPARAKDFAASEWHYNPQDHRCPHDAWIQQISVVEHRQQNERDIRPVQLELRLLGGYHDRVLTITYFDVKEYWIEATPQARYRGHGDWLYDEVDMVEGNVVHSIEFDRALLRIVCVDFDYTSTLMA